MPKIWLAGIHLMMTKQGDDAKDWHDYVLGSGVCHTVLDFLRSWLCFTADM
jgi:hypothetical protein